MAKHPHKLMLVNKKTWKCALEGCSFFVHLGLQHILINKHATCWDCDELFSIAESSLLEDKPRCSDCRGISTDAINQLLKDKGML